MKNLKIFLAAFLSLCCLSGCGDKSSENSEKKSVSNKETSITDINYDESSLEEDKSDEEDYNEQVIYESETTKITYVDVLRAPTSDSDVVFYVEFENFSNQPVEIEFGRTSIGVGAALSPRNFDKVYVDAQGKETLEFTLKTLKDNGIEEIGTAKTSFYITNQDGEKEETGILNVPINKTFF